MASQQREERKKVFNLISRNEYQVLMNHTSFIEARRQIEKGGKVSVSSSQVDLCTKDALRYFEMLKKALKETRLASH